MFATDPTVVPVWLSASIRPESGPSDEEAHAYLVYARHAKDGKGLVAGICSRTTLLAEADEDLRYLRELSSSRDAGARLHGTISQRNLDASTGEWRSAPVPDVQQGHTLIARGGYDLRHASA